MKGLNLSVQIEINGTFVKAGEICGTDSGDAAFSYSDSYLTRRDARAISLSLPLEKRNFDPEATKTFFDGLLPEGFTRQCVADSIHAFPDDYISILRELGSECLGAVQIVDEKRKTGNMGYTPVSLEEIEALAKEGAGKSADIVIKSHLSLTGASGKVGLYREGNTGHWFKPHGLSPSTHIVKQSHVRYRRLVLNEQLCLLTARKLGIEVPNSFILKTRGDNATDGDVLFATRRYDRLFDGESKVVGGFRIPYRLHQEDFAQALGIKSADKYEKNGEGYLKKMFGLLRKFSSDPIDDTVKLWRRTVFNYLIGNTDNHIKNSALLYDKDLSSIRLAPCYDVVCTTVYEGGTDEMSMSINGQLNIHQVRRDDFEQEARNCGLGAKLAMRIYDELQDGLDWALTDCADNLQSQGFLDANEMADRIRASRPG